MSCAEIAAKTLSNLASNQQSRKSIRLAGGVPPLVNLLTQRPSTEVCIRSGWTQQSHHSVCPRRKQLLLDSIFTSSPYYRRYTEIWQPCKLHVVQVLMACEEALKRLGISNEERNAVLETLHYCDQQQKQSQRLSPEPPTELPNGTNEGRASSPNLPLTQ